MPYILSMWPIAPTIAVTPAQRRTLEAWVCAASTPQGSVARARIVLLAAEGISNHEIARQAGTSRPTVLLWRRRFQAGGPSALTVIEAGRGRKPSISAEKERQIVEATLRTTPKGATHWSCRTMARAQGVSPATVQRIWRAHGLQPHRVKAFNLSTDTRFVEKLTDVVGLYLNPPDKAAVLCVDEKSQIQALDRTQPGLPMKKGRAGTMTHDYKRNGTTTLFAALNVLDGTVIGQCLPRHRHQEFLRFLRRLDREFPPDLALHLIVDNYGTHNHPAVHRWLAGRPRFHLHFTPTSASWLNLVERWFRELTQKRIRRGTFPSTSALIQAIREFLDATNADPRPFLWTASVATILKKVQRGKAILETLH
jgi:transposase